MPKSSKSSNLSKTLPITKAREELPTIVRDAQSKMSEYVITVHGSPAAVVISADEYESWKETNAITHDKKLMKAIKKGERDIKKGRFHSLEDIKNA